jgi:hypothetical protein
MNEQPKQETLEEASENNYPEGDIWTEEQAVIRRLAFMKGAKWQQEQNKKLYSEEEVIELLQKALTHQDDGETGSLVTAQGKIRPANFFSWFEQFKKK